MGKVVLTLARSRSEVAYSPTDRTELEWARSQVERDAKYSRAGEYVRTVADRQLADIDAALAALPAEVDLAAAPIPPVAFVVQDGEMFYIHTDAAEENYVAFRQAPIPVEYFNTEDAAKARAWLVAAYPATQFHFI